MEPITRQIHIAGLRGHIQPGKNPLNLARKLWRNSLSVPSLVEPRKSSMPETENHTAIVTCHLIGVKGWSRTLWQCKP